MKVSAKMVMSTVVWGLLIHGFARAETMPATTSIATSIPPLACMVAHLAGPEIKSTSIIPPGANHETFEPGFSQIQALVGSKLILSTGHPFFTAEDSWVKRVYSLNREITRVKLFNQVCGSTTKCPDPHIWVSAKLYPDLLRSIADALKRVDNNSKIIDNGFATTIAQFNESLKAAHELLEPYRGRSFLTSHSAWPYFSEEFGLTELSLEKGGKEVGLAGLTALTKAVQSNGITTLFVESVESATAARNFADSNKLELVELNPIGLDCVDFPRLVALKLVSSFK